MTIYRAWRPQQQWHIFRDTVRESSMILMIIAAAALFSYMLSLLYVSQTAAEWLVGLGLNKMHRTVEVEGTPEVLGQVRKVQHLVSVEQA